jgi:hypothetical protein
MPDGVIPTLGAKYNGIGLKVSNLPAGKYDLLIDGVKWDTVTADQSAAGVNLGARPSPLYPSYDEYLKRSDAGQDQMNAITEVKAFVLPGWIRQPDFQQQRDAEIARRMAALDAAQRQLRELLQPKPHQLELKPVP